MLDLPIPLAVVCHDAGAANIILSWVESGIQFSPETAETIRIFALGPAKRLLNNFDIGTVRRCASLEEAMEGAQALLAGTGWATSLELRALALAKRMGIRAVAVIDHWTNYRERFCIEEWRVDPEEIWVTDFYAKTIAERVFPDALIVLQVNRYLARAVERIKAIPMEVHVPPRVLYLLEPIRAVWAEGKEAGEFDALDYFLAHLDELSLGLVAEVRLRPHPSDPPGKYARWLARQGTPQVLLDGNPSVESSIAWADAG